MDKRKIVRYLLITLSVILGVLVFLSITGTVAHAAGLVDNTVSDANTYSKYPLENYQLDFYVDSSWDWLPWNWLDGIGKSIQYGLYAITNFVWTVSLYISNATGYVVQEAYKLDFISDTASSIGKNIQTLAGITSSGFSSEGFYVGFLLILILVMGIYVAYTGLIKRETTKAVHAVINFLVVFILSASFIAYAPNYISKINDFSADISSSALSLGTKIVLPDSSSKGKDSVDLIRDSLFSIQVKQPWLLLQYGESDIETLGSDRVESLLSESPDTDDREDVVIEEIEDKDNDNLSVTKTMTRLGMVVFLFIFNIGISAFVFLLTGLMIFSQVLFIIYAMFLPISFILSMIPTYEGMAKKALTKLFNTIMMRAGITLIITTAFSGDALESGRKSKNPMTGGDWHNYFNENYGADNVTWESASIQDIIDMPSKITDFSPKQISNLASRNGWTVEPLGKGRLAGIPYEQGGGISMHAPNGSSIYIQYHPGSGHHGVMPYYKISSGKNGIVRYYINGERVQ